MQGNYPSFNFREHFFLLYKCKSCNFFAVPATVFIGLLLALPVTMIIIGKWTFLSSILFSLFVYMNITAKSAEDDIHTQLIQYTVFLLVQYLFLWTFIPRYQRITLSINIKVDYLRRFITTRNFFYFHMTWLTMIL